MSTLEHNSVSLPSSYIKAPGFLLKDKKDPSDERTKQKRIQEKLTVLKAKIESSHSPVGSFSNIPLLSTERVRTPKTPKHSLMNFMSAVSYDTVTSPGKLKNFSEETANLLQAAKEILALYDVELFVENFKCPLEIMKLVKSLIMEISLFPTNFFKRLQIKQLNICHGEAPASPKQGVHFSPYILDTEEKPRKKLFKIIFEHLIVTNPDIINKWREIQMDHEVQALEGFATSLEDTFAALMSNTNQALLKPPMKKLRELLACYYPEIFSEEQFDNRNKEKKKIYRVRFES